MTKRMTTVPQSVCLAAVILASLTIRSVHAAGDRDAHIAAQPRSATQSQASSDHPADEHAGTEAHGHQGAGGHEPYMPHVVWIAPFVSLLLCIAILPLLPSTEHWWEQNVSKLLVALMLSFVTLGYYMCRAEGFHDAPPGFATVGMVLHHAIPVDYIPFIVLLFSLYVITGGINLSGDLPARPSINTAFIGTGAVLASFIGTTGAAMLLIRPLLQTNSERKYVKHTVIVFIFLVCNIGGCLLPIGDPPLFLGYLRGVPFLWTFHLWKEWLFANALLLVLYYFWDLRMYRKEGAKDIKRDETERQPVRLLGSFNILLLLGVVLAVGTLVPGQRFPGTTWEVPRIWGEVGLREFTQLALAGVSMALTSKAIRRANSFNFTAIGEVASLFIGIFICMQVPIEILHAVGPKLPEYNLTTPGFFFWATGLLSSFLDNAPTYVVYFETARTIDWADAGQMLALSTGGYVAVPLLVAVSLGAVFMGANSYIGNGPNFMVKSIAERAGVQMPSFFGYMAYSICILVPLFIVVTFVFL